MINGNVSSELILEWFASVYKAESSIQNCVWTLVLSTRTVTLQDVPLLNVTSDRPYTTTEGTILVWEYPENYQK